MNPFYILFLIFAFASVQGQFLVSNGTQFSVKNQNDLYTDIKLVNEGEIVYDTGNLYIDAGLDNSAGTLTLNDAVLHLGSNTARADGNHELIFNTDDTVKFVELGKITGATYTVNGGLLNITNTFTSNSGTLEAGNKIVLKSTSIQNTALVPKSSGGVVNNIRVERFIPAERAWRFMTSPVTTSQSIYENWQQNGLDPGDSGYRSNVGTHITGGTVTNGFDQSSTNNPSMYVYNPSNLQWSTIDNTNSTTLQNSKVYYILIRGDRSIDLSINDTREIATTLEQTGSLQIGTKSNTFDNTTAEQFIPIGNPYQAPVDMNLEIGSSHPHFKNQMWIWDQTDFSSGQFVHINLDTGTTSVTGSNVTKDLQPGQSGYFQTKSGVSGTVELAFDEANKVGSGSLTATFKAETQVISDAKGFLRMGLYDVNSTPFTDVAYDGIIVRFNNQYSNSIDDYDGKKLFGEEESLAVSLNDRYLSVNNRKTPKNLNEKIDLSMFYLDKSEYVFSIELEGFASLPNGIMLWDKYLDSFTPLNDQDLIRFSVDATIPESIAEDRFALVFKNATLGVDDQSFPDVSFYPNPVNDYLFIQFSEALTGTKIEAEIYSINGVLVKRKIYENPQQTLKLNGLHFSKGVYILKLKQGDLINTFKIIKK